MRESLIFAIFIVFSLFMLRGQKVAFAACSKAGEGCGASSVPPGATCCLGLRCADVDLNPAVGEYKCETAFGFIGHPYDPFGTGGYGPGDLGVFLSNVVKAIFVVSGLLLFLYLVFGGFKYMMAGGDEKAVMAAKNMLTNAGVGIAIVVAAWFITKVLEVVLGIDILSTKFVGP